MKREPTSESADESTLADKRPKTESMFDEVVVVSGKPKDHAIIAPEIPESTERTGRSSTLTDARTATETPSRGKGKSKGRGRGRDQRARTNRRAWEEGQRPRRGTRDENAPKEDDEERGPRLPKRKVALLIGFCGTGYNGMQIQKDVHTIENTLFDAMVEAGAVSKDNSDDPIKVNLQRAARTDAGVHAASNVVSLKMITEPPDTPDVVARINELLPPEIRVWKCLRTLNGFNSRACDSRVYEYLFPSYALLPPTPQSPMARHTKPQTSPDVPDWAYWDRPGAESLDTMRSWRISETQLNSFRESAKLYEGTHNFYNFTVKLDHSDPSGLRYMLSIDVKDPQVIDGTEWISIIYHGQSFMLHQIRKMTTLLILASRTGTPTANLIPQTFEPGRLTIPKAPALGLLLQEPRFGTYNKHLVDENEAAVRRGQTDRVRELIEWGPLRDQIDAFKREFIYSRLRAEEMKHGVFAGWLKFIDEYDGPEFAYLNPQGEIPSEARGNRKRGATDKFKEYLWKSSAGKDVEPESSDDGKPDAETEG